MKTLRQILEVDNRSRQEKIQALIDHPSTPEGIRNNAKAALAKAHMAPPSDKPKYNRLFSSPPEDWTREEKHDYHKNAAKAHNNGYAMAVRDKMDKEYTDYHWNEKQHHDREAAKYSDDDGTYTK